MSRHRQKNLNFYKWTSLFCLLLVLITGSVLIYQHKIALREREQELKALAEHTRKQYNLQQEHLVSTNDLVNSSKVHSFFTDLLRNYAEKFASSKNLDISPLPLKFAKFYSDRIYEKVRDMGRCWKEPKISKISLNHLYLLNKFGHDKYFTIIDSRYGDYSYFDISFDKMINTCSHELAHYFQFVKHGKSSCESDLIVRNGRYDEELAKEHEKWTKEIYQLIKNSEEYSELEKRWKEIN